jgi:uroporphyrinogen III methyltransferase/synthase
VRLKGGDPYLFGRGAEELDAIIKENIPFEVVPGVSSAIAVPAYAGIPVSHRDFSSSVHIITAHRQNGKAPDLDYQSLVRFGGTLVFLMGIGTIDTITSGLITAGMPGETPAALIENGTRPNQRKLVSSLAEISGLGHAQGFAPPSILLVGSVCSLHKELDWFSMLPLHKVRIIVTRPEARSALSSRLRELGADVINFPCIRTKPLTLPDTVFSGLGFYNWIVFTSPAGTEVFFDELKARKLDIRVLSGVKIAAIGEKTASIFRERGINVDYIPEKYNARELGTGLPYNKGDSVLLFRAKDGTAKLAATLKERGFSVEDLPVYETVRESNGFEHVKSILERCDADCLTFTSASTVQGFDGAAAGISFDRSGLKAICIGEETAAEAEKRGYNVIISKRATIESMVEAIIKECGA